MERSTSDTDSSATGGDSNRATTRREYLRRSAAIGGSGFVFPATGTDEAESPPATDLTVRLADIPWDAELFERETDVTSAPAFRELSAMTPQLTASDVAVAHYVPHDPSLTPLPPDVVSFVAVSEAAPDRGTIEARVSQWLSADHESGFYKRLDPEVTVDHRPEMTSWISTLSIQDATLRRLFTLQCIEETVFLTSVRAYDCQYSVTETGQALTQALRRRRREWPQYGEDPDRT